MPFNGSGIYNLPVTTVTPAVSGTTIDDAEFNTFTADLKSALTNCIVKDGQTSSPILTNPKILTNVLDTNGNEVLEFGTTASAVNHLKVTNRGAGSAPLLGALGEADTGIIILDSNGNILTELSPVASSVNYLREVNSATGNPVQITVGGTDTNIDLELSGKGAGDVVVTNLAATNAALTDATGSLTSPVINTSVSGTAGVSRMIQETAVATTSGTTVDFTSIPSWVKEVSVILDQVSSDAGTTDFICQIGDSGGLETTNYSYTVSTSKVASIVTTSNTADSSIHVTSLIPAASHCNGEIKIINVNSNVWEFSGLLSDPVSNELYSIAGRKSLSGTLDRLRFSLTSGLFDAGQVNIIYKG